MCNMPKDIDLDFSGPSDEVINNCPRALEDQHNELGQTYCERIGIAHMKRTVH